MVNDLGGPRDGSGGDQTMAQKVVEAIKAQGGRAVANGADISSIAGGQSVFEDAIKNFGRADILVNNAGILLDETFAKSKEANWDKVIRVHLKGTYCCTMPVFKWMRENGGGVIVNTSSTSGLIGNFGQTNYGAAKGGIWGLSNVLAIEGRKYNIRIWTLAPGALTRMTADLPRYIENPKAALGPDGIAPAVLYMVSDLSGDQTGKTLGVSGPRGVREMRMMEMEGWKPPGKGWKAQDVVTHAKRSSSPRSRSRWARGGSEAIRRSGARVARTRNLEIPRCAVAHLRSDANAPSRNGERESRITMKLTAQAAGTFAIAPTPFHDDGRIDEKSIDRLTDFYTEVGCDGVTVLGILGEAPKLDAAEAEQVAVRFVKRARNMQIIVGVSAPGFAAMRSLAKASMDAGAAGVMIAPPPHLRTDDQIVGYFKQAQEAIGDDIPWVLQDYPLTLNVVFTPAVIRKIVMDSPSCVMLKHEDWPGLEKISALRGFQKDGSLKPMSILVGNGGLFLDFEMERGADGAMTGYAFPELLIDIVNLSKAGKRDAAHDLFDAHLPLIRYEQQPGAGLAVRKYVLQKRGVIASSAQRKPGAVITAQAKAEVDYLLSRVARVDRRANLQPQSSAAG